MSKNKFFRLFLIFITCLVMSFSVFTVSACKDGGLRNSKTYTVTFDANGGTLASGSSSQSVESGKTATKPADPSYNGYVFDGWFTDKNCTAGNQYAFTEAVTADITLYAKWTEKTPDDGDPDDGNPDDGNPDDGNPDDGNPDDGNPDDGNPDDGDPDDGNPDDGDPDDGNPDDGDPDDGNPDDGNPDDGNPEPSEPAAYTVTFSAGEGAVWSNSQLRAQLVTEGEKAVAPDAPVKEGFALEGWYTDAACSSDKKYSFEAAVKGDITLYAKWVADPEAYAKFEVTFDSCGGSAVVSQEVRKGDRAVEPQAPVLSGKTFGGWFSNRTLSEEYDFTQPVTGDITLYAKWNDPVPQVTMFSVTFDTDGGEFGYSELACQFVREGQRAARPADPEKKDFVFGGWFTDKTYAEEYGFDSAVTEDVTLYAKWNTPPAVEYITVTLLDEQGTELAVIQNIEKGGAVTEEQLTSALAGKIPESHSVDGFVTESGSPFVSGTRLNGDTVLTVRFGLISTPVTVGFNSGNVAQLTKEDLTSKSYGGIINLNAGNSAADVKALSSALGNGIYYGGNSSYIEIDLTGVTGEVTVKVEMASGTAGRSAYLTADNTGNDTGKAVSADAVATATETKKIYSFEVTVEGGSKYYIRQEGTIYIYGVEVTYTPE